MRKFTEEDRKLLEPYEQKFNSAIHSRYITGLIKDDLTLLSSIYKEVIGGHINVSCSSCVLKMMIGLGNLYNKKKEIKDKEEEDGTKII